MNKKINVQVKKNNKKRVRPVKKLSRPLNEPIDNALPTDIIQIRRARFLRYMEEKHGLQAKKEKPWSGSALDFLELTDSITPSMRHAAHTYFRFSSSVLQDGPKRSQMRYEDPALYTAAQQQSDHDAHFEKHWQKICSILDQHQTKRLMDNLKSDQDLPCLETLFGTEHVLSRLKESLTEIEQYLHHVKEWRTQSRTY